MYFSISTLLVGLLIFYFGFVLFMRALRRLRRRQDKTLDVDFSIADLHEMLRRGQISAAEFERAREVVLRRSPRLEHLPTRGFDVLQRPPAAGDAEGGGGGEGDSDAGAGSRVAR